MKNREKKPWDISEEKPNVEDYLVLDEFQPRHYQKVVMDCLNRGVKRLVITWPRRSGKDFTLFQYCIRKALEEPCMILYVLPTYAAARKNIFDAIDNSGKTFLSSIPDRLIYKVNQSEMKIVFKNNSILQLVGAESHHSSIRGSNPKMVVLSEYAYYSDSSVLDTVTPIVAGNDGILVVASTPFGKNHYHALVELVKILPDWMVLHKTVEETQHIRPDLLAFEKARMDESLFAQEYYCSFDKGVDGSIFGKAIERIRQEGHINAIAWDPMLLTHVALDIGVNDATTLIWFQVAAGGSLIKIIDCYSNNNLGLDHYIAVIQEKPYWGRMGLYIAPHDAKVRVWSDGGITRYERARQMGIEFTILDQQLKTNQIDHAMTMFPKIWIDATKCKSLVDALENYYRKWDEQRQIYLPKPVHNWASDYCDAFMYMCQGVTLCSPSKPAHEYERIRREALYGENTNLPRVFRNALNNNQY